MASNTLFSEFANRICRNGLKSKANSILFSTFSILDAYLEDINAPNLKKLGASFLLTAAVAAVRPTLGIRKKKFAGVIRSLPTFSPDSRRTALAIRWIVGAAKKRREKGFASRLAYEIIDACRSSGRAFGKRQELHNTVIASRSFLRHKKRKKKKISSFPQPAAGVSGLYKRDSSNKNAARYKLLLKNVFLRSPFVETGFFQRWSK